MQQAISGHIGMLTCQVIELQVQLQAAHQKIAELSATQLPPDTPS